MMTVGLLMVLVCLLGALGQELHETEDEALADLRQDVALWDAVHDGEES